MPRRGYAAEARAAAGASLVTRSAKRSTKSAKNFFAADNHGDAGQNCVTGHVEYLSDKL
jgi:hypothetical protein